MSTLRNAVQRRNHKERAQPKDREKWGILEKHKDYTLRAQAYAAKKTHLRHLRAKAAARNPDEFSFSMVRAATRGGVKLTDRGTGKSLSQDAVRLLKTQDAGYLRTERERTRRERERLERGSVVLGKEGVRTVGGRAGKEGGHVVFVEGRGEQRELDTREWFGVEEEEVGRAWNRRRRGGRGEAREDAGDEQDEGEEEDEEDEEDEADEEEVRPPRARTSQPDDVDAMKLARQARRKRYRAQQALEGRVAALREREEQLAAAEGALALQRARMGNAVGGVNKNGVKWKVRERKR